ncbi:MAG: sigma-70 family RNA polymerase sigma factor [Lachnospiraceae bacterium]|nr:sigma-70 family RNA polymerase sigma factor [Lachnospiraceae bacterium]
MEVDPKLKSAVEKLKSGNDEAFNEVYQKTYNYVYFRAKQVMKNEDDAMDLMQIVYMEAYKSIKSLDKAESIYSWLSSITFRQGMKIFQKKKEILLDEDFENIFDSVETSDIDSRPELSFERKEQQRLVASLIDSLPEVQRATMVAFYYDNIKIEEIAEVMDCSVGTVKSRLSYARQALKKKLEAAEKGGKTGAGKMALTGALIFGAVQILSEETVLAAPVAAGVFGNICSGLGIAATGAAIAGTALAGGAGISAATGTVAGSTAIATGAAVAGTTAAAGTAAAGTAAAGTAVAGTAATAAAGTAATAAGTAAAGAAGTAAAGAGAAKGLAVAVAVAVAGTGGTVGTTIYRSTVSSADKVSSNEEGSTYDEAETVESTAADEIIETADTAEPATEIAEEASTVASPEHEGVENAGTETAAEEGAHDSTAESTEAAPTVESAEDEVDRYGMSKKLKNHIASAVASLFMTSGSVYSGSVNNENLEAAYILEHSLFKSKKEIKALSVNSVFLSHPSVVNSVKEGDVITIEGSFDVGKTEENGSLVYENYNFVLHGNRIDNKGVFGHFNATDLEISKAGETKTENTSKKDKKKESTSANEAAEKQEKNEKSEKTEKTDVTPAESAVPVQETEIEVPLPEFYEAEPTAVSESVIATVSESGS